MTENGIMTVEELRELLATGHTLHIRDYGDNLYEVKHSLSNPYSEIKMPPLLDGGLVMKDDLLPVE